MKEKGKVKWFNEKKGWGFIIGESGDEVFAHYSEIVGEGFKTLRKDEEVEFEKTEKEKGFYAKNIVRVSDSGAEPVEEPMDESVEEPMEPVEEEEEPDIVD